MRDWRFLALVLLAAVAAVLAAGRCYEVLAEAHDAASYPPAGKLIDVGEHKLHLLCRGPSSGLTVVMVAGGGTPAVVSYEMQDRIARFARVCSYDRPGLGWSAGASRPLTFVDHANDLITLLHRARLPGPYLFVPESFGSLIVLDFVTKHPAQTAGVVFLDGVDPQLWFVAMKEQSGISADIKNDLIGAAWRIGAIRLMFQTLAPEWVSRLDPRIRGEMTAIYSRPSAGYDEALQAYRVSPPTMRPVLVAGLLGDRPVIAVRHARSSGALSPQFEAGWNASQMRLASLSRRGIVVTAPGADHDVAQEQADFAAQIVKQALSQLH